MGQVRPGDAVTHHPLREIGHVWLLVPAALAAIAAAGLAGFALA